MEYTRTIFVSNTEIQFCLVAQDFLDQNEIAAEPINYKQTSKASWQINNDMKFASSQGSDAILPSNLINIWICNLQRGKTGFAQMPGGSINTDGIVIDYNYIFGKNTSPTFNYKNGVTLSHLIASYLNLYELWQPNCGDDKVHDTPVHNSVNYGCPKFAHSSTCLKGFYLEMSMNFMDNTDDACQYMFTNGQKTRMHASLAEDGPRSDLRILASCDVQNSIVNTDISIPNIQTRQSENTIKVYPNPTDNGIWIELDYEDKQHFELTVISPDGRIVKEGKATSPSTTYLDLSDVQSGIYFLQVNNEVINFSKSIVIQ